MRSAAGVAGGLGGHAAGDLAAQMMPVRRSGLCTGMGPMRRSNEDRIYADHDTGIWRVAGGLGGPAACEIAAQIVSVRRSGLCTGMGPMRRSNEDRIYADDDAGIYRVAARLGGHAACEIAAQTAMDVVIGNRRRP